MLLRRLSFAVARVSQPLVTKASSRPLPPARGPRAFSAWAATPNPPTYAPSHIVRSSSSRPSSLLLPRPQQRSRLALGFPSGLAVAAAGRRYPAATATAAFSAAAAASSSPTMGGPLSWLFRAAGAAGGWVAVDFLIQWGGWAVSSLLKTEKLYDLFGTGTFALVALGSFARSALPSAREAGGAAALLSSLPYARQAAATACVALWAARLGSFLVYRVNKTGHDSRFDEAKHDPAKFFVFWTLQGAWVAVTAAPVLLLNAAPPAAVAAASATRLVWTDVAGLALWLCGFLTEAAADAQKLAFKLDAGNAGKFVDTGLWSLARYPNYGGEIMAWAGVGLLCAGSGLLSGWRLLACAASPAFVAALLLGLSGVPIQERQARARWGDKEEYRAYRARTNLLLPLPFALPVWLGGPDREEDGQRQPLAPAADGDDGDGDDGDKTN